MHSIYIGNALSSCYIIHVLSPLILLGHPIGATGLGQCAELIWQVNMNIYITYHMAQLHT